MRNTGTIAVGIRTPIVSNGDNIVDIVFESVMKSVENGDFAVANKDIIGITEAVVGRAQGNFATIDQIAEDVKNKVSSSVVGLVSPIFSRNRFSICLAGIAKAMDKIYLQMPYPADEVGNHLFEVALIEKSGVNPFIDVLNEKTYREKFGFQTHRFTGVDYVTLYREIIESQDCEVEFVFANSPTAILNYTTNVIACDIHSRFDTKKAIERSSGKKVFTLTDFITTPVDGSGHNETYGLLGSNKATDSSVKLFPRDCDTLVDQLAKKFYDATGKNVEIIIYGDGAFKDPVGKIWELADPVVGVAFTDGLKGVPNEIKLKYVADNELSSLHGEELNEAMRNIIKNKGKNELDAGISEGTTPRQISDLIGSLCDLISGSGDKGTPVVYIKGYFDNYSSN